MNTLSQLKTRLERIDGSKGARTFLVVLWDEKGLTTVKEISVTDKNNHTRQLTQEEYAKVIFNDQDTVINITESPECSV